MTLNEFLDALAKADFLWYSTRRGRLRTDINGERFCPITAVAFKILKKKFTVRRVNAAAKELGLSDWDGCEIAWAADQSSPHTRFYPLRSRIEQHIRVTGN